MQPRAPDTVQPMTPQQARDNARHTNGPKVEAAVVAFNESVHDWDGTGIKNFAVALFGNAEPVRRAVVERLNKAGWNVEFHSDQRDGDFYSVTMPEAPAAQ